MRLWAPLLALAFSACVPFPHNQQESPKIQGTLIADGVAAANVKVQIAVNPPNNIDGCPAGAKETLTDGEGRFSFESTSYFSAFIVMGDRYDAWRICFAHPDGRKAVWQGGGFWGGPPTQMLKCDLEQMKYTKDSKATMCTAQDKRP